MHRIMLRRIIVSAIFLISLAQGTKCPAQGGLPNGTYRQTCQNVYVNGNMLSARCQKPDGGWRNTSIDYNSCRGSQIINDNGYLRCGGGGNIGVGRAGLPQGDYKRTCRDIRINGNKLYAICQNVDGGWHDTSLNNFNLCHSPIANDNGNLRCPK